MIRPIALAALLSFAIAQSGQAAGAFDDDEPPTPTATTQECDAGEVWDAAAEACIAIQDSRLDHPNLMQAARELAYGGRPDDAIALLEGAAMPEDSMVLTYLGFAHRRAGRMDTGLDYYDAALVADPDNLLARSYMGMAFVQLAQPDLAQDQLDEILARGGDGTWPAEALSAALAQDSVDGYDY